MTQTSEGKPPLTSLLSSPVPSSAQEDLASDLGTLAAPEPEPDPYDALWDPDMDTRPERIRRGRARRPDGRPRGVPIRKRRDG